MLTLTIDNPTVENIFLEGFNANKENFLDFIQESYQKIKHLDGFKQSHEDTEYQQNRATISRQVDAYRDGTAKLLTEEESSVIMNTFMKDLKTKHAHPQR